MAFFRQAAFTGLLVIIFSLVFVPATFPEQEVAFKNTQDRSEISPEKYQEARKKAEQYDREGDFTRALQYYLECIRQADGLKKKEAAAWARNNAAYMLIKQHWKDRDTDLRPAKHLLEEALALEGFSPECRQKLQSNLQYVLSVLRE